MLSAVWSCEEESAVLTGNGKRASGGIRESNDWRVRGISITLTHTSSVAVVLSPDEFLSGRSQAAEAYRRLALSFTAGTDYAILKPDKEVSQWT